ncbi:Dabb family protein [Lachnoanaerobaculum gingivalis]
MLKHIVMWKFNECVDKQIIGKEIKSSLLNLCKSMDEVIMADIVYNVLPTSTHDIILILDVKDEDALNKYATSKEHVAIVENLIKPNTNSRVAIDILS